MSQTASRGSSHRGHTSEGQVRAAIWVARMGVLLLLAAAPFIYGAVHLWAWAALGCVAVLLLAPVLVRAAGTTGLRTLPWPPLAFLLVVAVVGGVQMLPLPFLARSFPEPLPLPGPEALQAIPEAARATLAVASPRRLTFALDATRDGVTKALLAAAIVVLVSQLFRREVHLRVFGWTIAATGALLGAIGLAARHGRLEVLAGYSSPYSTYINRNHFAGFVELALPLGVALVLISLRGLRRQSESSLAGFLASAGLSAVMATALVDSQSRGGLFGALAGLAAMSVALLRVAELRRWVRPFLVLLVLGGLAVTLFFDDGQSLEYVTRTRAQEGSVVSRVAVWKETLKLITLFPVAGVGLGAFEYAIPLTGHGQTGIYPEHPENDYLQLAAEGGIVAVLAAAIFLALGLRSAWRWRPGEASDGSSRGHEAPRAIWWAASSGGIVALLVHGLVDVNLHVPANLMLFFALTAVFFSQDDSATLDLSPSRSGGGLGLTYAATGVALLVCLAHLARVAVADAFIFQVLHNPPNVPLVAEDAARKAESNALLEKALRLDPVRSDAERSLGHRYGEIALAPDEASHDAERAAALAFVHLDRACRLRPAVATYVFELGWMAASWGLREQSPSPALAAHGEALMRRGVALDASFADQRAVLGAYLVLAHLDRPSEGLAEIQTAFRESPGLQDRMLPFLDKRLPLVLLSKTIPDRPENRYRYACYADQTGRLEEARHQYERTLTLATPDPAARSEYSRKVALRLLERDPARALAELEKLTETPSPHPDDLLALSRAQSLLGRHEDAIATLRRAVALTPRPDLRLSLGWEAYRSGDCGLAFESAAIVLASQAANLDALHLSALCDERGGDYSAAIALLQRLTRLAPERPDFRDDLARVEGKMAEALGEATPASP